MGLALPLLGDAGLSEKPFVGDAERMNGLETFFGDVGGDVKLALGVGCIDMWRFALAEGVAKGVESVEAVAAVREAGDDVE